MNPTLTKLIEQYLGGELSPEDTLAFESRMEKFEELRVEVEKQREIHEASKRAYQRQGIQKIGKKFHLTRFLKRGGISLLIGAVIATAAWYFIQKPNSEEKKADETLTEDVRAQLDKEAQFERLPIQYFSIPEEGAVVLSEQGVLISVPENAFLLNGKPYKGQLSVQFQEALTSSDIIKSGLSTMSNGQLLETGGMVGITGFTMNGKELEFNPEVGVYVQVPANDDNPDMKLYTGEKSKDGTINWVNPQELEKIPVAIPMSKLDFYPTGYEDHLDKIKWKQKKTSRDSLYLSLESEQEDYALTGEQLFSKNCATCHTLFKDGTGPKLHGVTSLWEQNGADLDDLVLFVQDWTEAAKKSEFIASRANLKPTAMSQFRDKLSEEQILSIYQYIENPNSNAFYAQDHVELDSAQINYILPSKVLGFWNENFNNTNLATHEFERRMQAIHSTCNNSVLDVYLKNIDEPMHKSDAEVASMGYGNFQKFAAERVGKVDAKNPHTKQLQKFYEKSVNQLQSRNKILQKEEQKRRDNWDDETAKEREKEQKRTVKREAQALQEEFKFNMNHVKKQLGSTRGFTVRHGRGTVLNIDAQVMQATINRVTTTITDPTTGKTAKIIYNDFTFEVENPDQYIKLYAYVMPYELNSYQRIEAKNGKFNHPLNNEIRYNVAVVGVTENGYAYFQKQNFKKGDLGTIQLKEVSETALDASVEQLNRNRRGTVMRITEELDWLARERADYKEQKMRRAMAEFRYELKCIAFPCYGGMEYVDSPKLGFVLNE